MISVRPPQRVLSSGDAAGWLIISQYLPTPFEDSKQNGEAKSPNNLDDAIDSGSLIKRNAFSLSLDEISQRHTRVPDTQFITVYSQIINNLSPD